MRMRMRFPFSTANLQITYPQGIEVITQGQAGKADTLGTQVTRQWVVENPVPVLSLNAGEYRVYRATIHDIECALYAHPSHLRQSDSLKMPRKRFARTRTNYGRNGAGIGHEIPLSQSSVVEIPSTFNGITKAGKKRAV